VRINCARPQPGAWTGIEIEDGSVVDMRSDGRAIGDEGHGGASTWGGSRRMRTGLEVRVPTRGSLYDQREGGARGAPCYPRGSSSWMSRNPFV